MPLSFYVGRVWQGRVAAAAKVQVNRDMLLAAAARWRRMAKVARELDEVTNLDHTPLA
jgi:hypothetical protein